MGNSASVIELGQGKIQQDFTGKNLEENYMLGVYEKETKKDQGKIPEFVNNHNMHEIPDTNIEVCYDYFGTNSQPCKAAKPAENSSMESPEPIQENLDDETIEIVELNEKREIVIKLPTMDRMREMEKIILDKILYPVPITFTKGMFGKTSTETHTSIPILGIENNQFGTKAIKWPLILPAWSSFFKGQDIENKRGFYLIGKTIDMFHEIKVETFPTDSLVSAELYIGLTEPIFMLKKVNLYMTNNKCEKTRFFNKAISNIFAAIPQLQFWIKIHAENTNDKIFDYFMVRRIKVYSYIFTEEFRREIRDNTDIPNDVINTLKEMESFGTEKLSINCK